eukprot:TRINITY_DN4268_c0_g1_i2.p1 TRINITY_DN4268_c0_g1~~TRINITY_DN4268_c0_g1_i2.p1  ORF type:complete len:456 (-),score=114.44 TRINITY_DN4268_c0_g1_i2:688-2055(-)
MLICCEYDVFFFQAEDGIRDLVRSRGLGDVYKRQINAEYGAPPAIAMAQTLRIITFNDVYQLDNLPRVKSFIDAHRLPNTLVTLPGDFLMPSMLSAIDNGKAMVAMLNEIGVDYVCIGNHEADVPLEQLHKRIQESSFTWLNTNMPDLPLPEGMEALPTTARVTVGERSVDLLTALTADDGVYKEGAFGGATVLEPIEAAVEQIAAIEDCSCAVVLSHLRMGNDRELAAAMAKCGKVPLILGGHDHDVYHESIDGVTVIKVGMDAERVALCDLSWATSEATVPDLQVTVHEMSSWEPHAQTQAMVEDHQSLLDALKECWLFKVPEGGLSSKDGRIQQTSLGSALTTQIKTSMNCDCCVWLSGAIRANKDYPAFTGDYSVTDSLFKFSDLRAELAFNDIAVPVKLPGSVISDTVCLLIVLVSIVLLSKLCFVTSRATALSPKNSSIYSRLRWPTPG